MSITGKIRQLVPDDETHLFELTRHFFKRFLNLEFISEESDAHLDVGQVLAVLMFPGAFFALERFWVYDYIYWHFTSSSYRTLTLTDQCLYVFFSMIVIGMVAVLEWDRLFPDGRDYANLMPLPVRMETIFCAKAAALAKFIGLFILAVAGIPVVMYPLISSRGLLPAPGLGHVIWMIMVHGIAIFSGCLFTVLFFVAVQGVLINLLSYRQFKRASLYVQGLAIIVLVCLLVLSPLIPQLLPDWEKAHSPLLYALPPMWFLGLYRTLLGSHNAIFLSLARISVAAFILATVMAVVTYLASYKRFSQRAFEWGEEKGPTRFNNAALLGWLLDRLWVKEGPERGTFYFVLKTLAQSATHRLYFVAYVAVGLAIVLIDFLVIMINASHGYFWASITRSGEALLAIPMVISFFTLLGMQAAFGLPSELGANWIFRITEQDSGRKCLAGARKAMIIVAVVPLSAAGFVAYSELWGPKASLMAISIGVLVSLILVEPLLYLERKIPFTCARQPGKSSLPLAGRGIWFAFGLYVLSLASLEKWVFQERAVWAVAVVAEIVILGSIVVHRNHSFANGLGVEFEDKPLPAVQTLDLNA
jgi:hypothetical protein